MTSIKEKLYQLDTPKSGALPSINKINHDQFLGIEAHPVETSKGLCIVREKSFNLDFTHGPHTLNEFLDIPQDIFELLGKRTITHTLNHQDIVFIDTETTGLAGGTGTYAFIVGIGLFTENEFKIHQFFLQDYHAEIAQLSKILQLIQSKSTLISYNGKSYDIPLLKNRFVLNKININWDEFDHIDLVHTSRRLWKKIIGSCRLQDVEKYILHIEREGDIPGYLIPQLYFRYLMDKNPYPLLGVFKHNAMDILSLVSIIVAASQLYIEPTRCTFDSDFHSAIRPFISLNRYNQALKYIEKLPHHIKQRSKLLHTQALLHKKLGESENALECYKKLIKTKRRHFMPAYIELAKLYEHKLKDYEKAMEVLYELEERICVIEELSSQNIFNIKDIKTRKSRLLNKMIRMGRTNKRGNK